MLIFPVFIRADNSAYEITKPFPELKKYLQTSGILARAGGDDFN